MIYFTLSCLLSQCNRAPKIARLSPYIFNSLFIVLLPWNELVSPAKSPSYYNNGYPTLTLFFSFTSAFLHGLPRCLPLTSSLDNITQIKYWQRSRKIYHRKYDSTQQIPPTHTSHKEASSRSLQQLQPNRIPSSKRPECRRGQCKAARSPNEHEYKNEIRA